MHTHSHYSSSQSRQVAHRSLYETIRQLEARHVNVPQSMRQKFVLIHSYMLTKSLVRRGDHEGAARMLIRVAKNVSEFPNHIVPILTSTVIECQRAGLKKSAFEASQATIQLLFLFYSHVKFMFA